MRIKFTKLNTNAKSLFVLPVPSGNNIKVGDFTEYTVDDLKQNGISIDYNDSNGYNVGYVCIKETLDGNEIRVPIKADKTVEYVNDKISLFQDVQILRERVSNMVDKNYIRTYIGDDGCGNECYRFLTEEEVPSFPLYKKNEVPVYDYKYTSDITLDDGEQLYAKTENGELIPTTYFIKLAK